MEISDKVINDILLMNSADAGKAEARGFDSHDRKNYENSSNDFFISLTHLIPWFDDYHLKKIANEKIEVLRHHDDIEENESLTKIQKLNKELWDDKVLPHAIKEAEILGIDRKYAENKVDFYRLHGQRKKNYKDKVINMEKYFSEGLVGKDLSQITGSLYLTCIAFHDSRRREKRENHSLLEIQEMSDSYSNYVYYFHKHAPNYENLIIPEITERYKTKAMGKGF